MIGASMSKYYANEEPVSKVDYFAPVKLYGYVGSCQLLGMARNFLGILLID